MNKSQAEIDAVAAENRQRFRARLRENKMKIEQAAEARPSLLIRHDQVQYSAVEYNIVGYIVAQYSRAQYSIQCITVLKV